LEDDTGLKLESNKFEKGDLVLEKFAREESFEWRDSETFRASLKVAVLLAKLHVINKFKAREHYGKYRLQESSPFRVRLTGVLDSQLLVYSMVKTGKSYSSSEQDISETSTLSGVQDVVRDVFISP
jgi:hypothetical protein